MPKVIELEGGQHGAKGRFCLRDLKCGDGEAFQPGVSGFELESRTERRNRAGQGQHVSEGRGCERAFLEKVTSSRRGSRQRVYEVFRGLPCKHHTSQLYVKGEVGITDLLLVLQHFFLVRKAY